MLPACLLDCEGDICESEGQGDRTGLGLESERGGGIMCFQISARRP